MSHEGGHHPNIVSRELFDAILAERDEARVRVRELEEDNERLQKDHGWFQTLASVLAKQAIRIHQLEEQTFGTRYIASIFWAGDYDSPVTPGGVAGSPDAT